MDGTGFVIGCGLIAMGIYYGLDKIADAVRYKRTDINFKDAIKIVHGTLEEFEMAYRNRDQK